MGSAGGPSALSQLLTMCSILPMPEGSLAADGPSNSWLLNFPKKMIRAGLAVYLVTLSKSVTTYTAKPATDLEVCLVLRSLLQNSPNHAVLL